MPDQTVTLSMAASGVATLTFDAPNTSANVLSRSVLEELSAHLHDLEKRNDATGLVICSGKPGMFIAGADLREFSQSLGLPREQVVELCRFGQTLFSRLSKCPFPTVAAIDGICLGGGAELAIWCDRRIMSKRPKTEMGFPEVKLGLFPGWGGTVRAPRIVGLANAVEMITGGDSVDADAAVAMDLVSDVVDADNLLEAALNLIQCEQESGDYLRDRERWNQPVEMNETELGFLAVTANAMIQQQTKGKYPAPAAALELMLESFALDTDSACQREAEEMSKLFGSPVNAALLNVFFLNDRIKKDRGVDRDDVEVRSLGHVGVIGAGIMGSGIASANLKRGVPVVMADAVETALQSGAKKALEEAAYNRKTKSADVHRALELAPLLNTGQIEVEVANCDLVIEAVVETAEVKKGIYTKLEPQLSETAILASNTSTLPITKLASVLQRPERFCGMHFFNPVRRMKLVEVIRGENTSDETVATLVAFAKRIGKLPIVVNDGPGFLVNRLLFPYMNEALQLLSQGAEMQAIDRAAKSFGMPMGPIELYDMVGMDTAFYAGMTMLDAYPDRIKASPILPAMVKAGRLGQKNGKGFFSYENRKKRPQPDPEVQPLIGQYIKQERTFDREELTNRLFLPMLLEATRALDEGIVRDVRDVDFGLIFGLGFPPFRGGLLFWADSIGAATIVEMLKPFEELGSRMQPTPMLQEMAKTNGKFYQ